MLTVPVALQQLIVEFAPLFSQRVWEHAQVLVVGAILAPGKRTVTAALRVRGLSQEAHFQNYHRVLNRARWASLAVARVLVMAGTLMKAEARVVRTAAWYAKAQPTFSDAIALV